MRKYIIALALIFNSVLFAQNPEIPSTTLTNYSPAQPTVSSLMNFAEISVNEFTGVPNISENIFSTNTLSKNVNFSMSYAYHPKGISLNQKSSDFGTGWSLNCGGAISRMVFFRPEVSNQNYLNESYADTYFFNFMGFTGSFQIKYDQNNVNPEIVLKRTDESNLKIEFIKDPNSNKIDSFTIYDTKGIKYVFSIFDVNVSTFDMVTPSGTDGSKNRMKLAYRSSWHLKEVIDTNNNKIIDFNYQTYNRVENNNTIPLNYHIQKLKEVKVYGFCKIDINHDYNAYVDALNSNYLYDAFNVKDIIIKNEADLIIKKIVPNFLNINFNISERDPIYPSNITTKIKVRRYLKEVMEFNSLNEEINKTTFSYKLNFPENKNLFLDSSGFINAQDSCFIKNPTHWNGNSDMLYSDYEFALSNKESSDIGILSGISYKIGGGYEFLFETNTFSKTISGTFTDISFAKLNDENKQFDLIHTIPYNTSNQNYVQFTIPNHSLYSKIYYFHFENQSLNIPPDLYPQGNNEFEEVGYELANNINQVLQSFSDHHLSGVFNYGENCLGKSLYILPGTYRINFSSYMNLQTNGTIKIYEENYKPNLNKYVYGGGNRIKEIKKFEKVILENLNFIEKSNLINSTSFEYNLFNESSKSSGELSYGGLGNSMYLYEISSDYQVNYKNVKKSFGANFGYTKSEYLTPSNPILGNLGYYAMKDGLPKLNQIYDNNGKLLNETIYNYTFEVDQTVVPLVGLNASFNQSFVKNKAVTIKNYFYPNGGTTPNIVESNETFTYNSLNKQIASNTVDNSLGEILTTNYFYHTGNSPFFQNRISEIERIETKRGTELLSESKINYSNTFAGNQSYLPSSIEVKKGSSPSEVRLKYNAYDEFGHVLEVQQESGIKISYIYGYNKSQPLAKIENIAYSAIPTALITNIQNASNGTNEQDLLTAFTALRNDNALSNAMITTYTYKPLIGVSTITDPKGDKITYHYDSFNRLEFVKDKNGNILSENQYHYKN